VTRDNEERELDPALTLEEVCPSLIMGIVEISEPLGRRGMAKLLHIIGIALFSLRLLCYHCEGDDDADDVENENDSG